MFKGSAVALITPFNEQGVDFNALEKLIDFHIDAGTECVLVCGTTGESATLTHDEHKKIVAHSAQYIRSKRGENRYPLLMAGSGSNNTAEALELTKAAKDDGADICLLITPYYNKPTQPGILNYFRTIAREVDIPQVVYNILSRTGVNVSTDVIVELAQEKNIIGVKEASGDIDQVSEVARRTPDDFYIWSGDDGKTLPILSVGGHGVISVAANIIPKDVRAFVHAYLDGKPDEALKWHRKMAVLFDTLFIETNPIPVKSAANILSRSPETGLPHCGLMRPPITPITPGAEEKLKKVMADYGLPVA